MKTSNKLRKQILNAVSAGVMSVLDERCSFHKESGPDDWTEEQKKLWDAVNEVETRAVQEIEAVLCR